MDLSELTKNIKKETTLIEKSLSNIEGGVNEVAQSSYSKTKSYLFRYTIRPIISVAVNNVHGGLKGKYDKDIYVYSDPRLLFLDKLTKEFIDKNVDNKGDVELLKKIVDITLGILKEDIYYRSRAFILLNKFLEENVRFMLTDDERNLIERSKE